MKILYAIVITLLIVGTIYSVQTQKNKKYGANTVTPSPTVERLARVMLYPQTPQDWNTYNSTYYSIAHPFDWVVEPSSNVEVSNTTLRGQFNGSTRVLEIGTHIQRLKEGQSIRNYARNIVFADRDISELSEKTQMLDSDLLVQKYIVPMRRDIGYKYNVYYLFARGNLVFFAMGYTDTPKVDEPLYDQMLSTLYFK